MSFHDVRFPTSISLGATGGPERRTEIVTLGSGFEERNSPWSQSRRRFDAGLGIRSLDQLAQVTAFFEARHGQLYAFRWKDAGDYKSCLPSETVSAFDQTIGTGDGNQTEFSLIKTYTSGEQTYVRDIKKSVEGTVVIAVDNVVTLDFTAADGVVTLDVAPANGAIVTAGFEFDVPVRFDTDRLDINYASFQAGQIPSVPVVEVRV